jgi:hypothetical protein
MGPHTAWSLFFAAARESPGLRKYAVDPDDALPNEFTVGDPWMDAAD